MVPFGGWSDHGENWPSQIHMARPNEPDTQPKNKKKKERLGITVPKFSQVTMTPP